MLLRATFSHQKGMSIVNRHFIQIVAVASILLILAPQISTADDHNLLVDASFELRVSAEDGGWNLFDESRFAADVGRSGDQSIFHAGFSRTVAYPPYFLGTVAGSFQEFPAAPGSQWQLTGYGMAATALQGASAFGIVQVSFFDASGNDLGTVETAGETTPAKISNKVDSQSPAGKWILLDTGIATAPEGTATIQAFTLYVDYSGSDTAQGVYFDDLTLREISDDQ